MFATVPPPTPATPQPGASGVDEPREHHTIALWEALDALSSGFEAGKQPFSSLDLPRSAACDLEYAQAQARGGWELLVVMKVVEWLESCAADAFSLPAAGPVVLCGSTRWPGGCGDPDQPAHTHTHAAAQVERALVQHVWKCLRSGLLREAQEACVQFEQHWRSASLGGAEMWADAQEAGGRIGNPFRLQWQWQHWQNAQDFAQVDCADACAADTNTYERACAAVCGANVNSLLGSACVQDWWDAVWGLFVCVRDARFAALTHEHRLQQLTRTRHVPVPRPYSSSAPDLSDAQAYLSALSHGTVNLTALSVPAMFDLLEGASCVGEWGSKGGEQPFAQFQKYLVLASFAPVKYGAKLFNELQRICFEVSPAANAPTALHAPHALEPASAHALPVLRGAALYVVEHPSVPAGVTSAHFWRTCDTILISYARHLMACGMIEESMAQLAHVKDLDRAAAELTNFMHFIGSVGARQLFVQSLVHTFSEMLGHTHLPLAVLSAGVSSLINLTAEQFRCTGAGAGVGVGVEAWLPTPPLPVLLGPQLGLFDWSRIQAVAWLNLLEDCSFERVIAANALLRLLAVEADACDCSSVAPVPAPVPAPVSESALGKRFAMRVLLLGVDQFDMPPIVQLDSDDQFADCPHVLDEHEGWCLVVCAHESFGVFLQALAHSHVQHSAVAQSHAYASDRAHAQASGPAQTMQSYLLFEEVSAAVAEVLPAVSDAVTAIRNALTHCLLSPSPEFGLPDVLNPFARTPLAVVRGRVVPVLASRLHSALFDSGLWYLSLPWDAFQQTAVGLLKQSLQVADMVADVNFSLSTCYSVEQLDDLLDLVQSSQEQLMHTVGFCF